MKAIFLIVPLLSIPAFLALAAIPAHQIDYWRARGGSVDGAENVPSNLKALVRDRVLPAFAISAFLFHFANAAMLPQLGEMLALGRVRDAAPFMAATVTVTQLVIAVTAPTVGRLSARLGPRPLLLFGFAVLPIRGVLYTLTSSIPLLIAIQTLDGVANSIFGVASAVLIADHVRGLGQFNLATGALGTVVGIGAALSNTAIALLAFLCLLTFVPNTREQ